MPYLLAKNKMKATDLAKDLKISDGFISQVIAGKRYFSYPMAAMVAKRLGCSMEELHDWYD